MPPIELDPIPEGSRPAGSVIGNFSASAMEVDGGDVLQYHRPHAFALYHGEHGAKVAYGQLLWRVDRVDFAFSADTAPPPPPTGKCVGAGQTRAIKGLEVAIPTVKSPDGPAMDPTVPNIYHELDAYGDVYLYWKVELDDSEGSILAQCWVEVTKTVDGEEVGATETNDIDTVATANTTHDRFTGAGSSDSEGIYRVKLGAVKENELVTQDISTDVYWSTVVLTRDQTS